MIVRKLNIGNRHLVFGLHFDDVDELNQKVGRLVLQLFVLGDLFMQTFLGSKMKHLKRIRENTGVLGEIRKLQTVPLQ